jgi:hypothetical protein
MVHGASGVEPVFAALLGVLEKEGLERIDPLDQPSSIPTCTRRSCTSTAKSLTTTPRVVEVLRPATLERPGHPGGHGEGPGLSRPGRSPMSNGRGGER